MIIVTLPFAGGSTITLGHRRLPRPLPMMHDHRTDRISEHRLSSRYDTTEFLPGDAIRLRSAGDSDRS
jgi:hypothetical protein